MLKVKPFRESPGLCGPASLKMVLEYYGVRVKESKLAKLTHTSVAKGASGAALVRAAKKYGFRGFFHTMATIGDIKDYVVDKKIPVIVDWFSEDDGHYSVVVGIDDEFIYMQDPEIARCRKMDLDTFKRVWFDFPGDYLRNKRELVIRRMVVIHP